MLEAPNPAGSPACLPAPSPDKTSPLKSYRLLAPSWFSEMSNVGSSGVLICWCP